MVFVGDYIYEGAARAGDVRRHVGGETRTLADYRNRHAQYKTDRDLQRLHAAVPWLVTWDDHEVDNNYAGTRDEALDPNFRTRRAAAYQAYYEHMPLRQRARPTRSGVVLRARQDFGRLARFHVLDGRQRWLRAGARACWPSVRPTGTTCWRSCVSDRASRKPSSRTRWGSRAPASPRICGGCSTGARYARRRCRAVRAVTGSLMTEPR
jgi:hypothetical protein